MTKPELDATGALDRFFSVVRRHASENPKFAAELLDAIGVDVYFRGAAALPAVDPLLVAMRGQEEFRKTFLTFPAAQLKAFVKEFNLATADDMKGKSKPAQIVEVMWEGAASKIRDRRVK